MKETSKRSDVIPNNAFYYRFVKRLFDIVFSIISLILLSPLMLIISLMILLSDVRPVFFSQKRAGLNGEPFNIHKFRTMIPNAPELLNENLKGSRRDGPVWKIQDDPRVTKTGAFLRRTDLDELPQLLNILRGEMSVVGPRPLADYEVRNLTPYERQRLLVKPGLICTWQLRKNEDIPFAKRTEIDLDYIRNAGILTDLRIILMTIPAILNGKNRGRADK